MSTCAHDPGDWRRQEVSDRPAWPIFGHDHLRDERTEWYEQRYNQIWYDLSPEVRAELYEQEYTPPQSEPERFHDANGMDWSAYRVDQNEKQGVWCDRSCNLGSNEYKYEQCEWRQKPIHNRDLISNSSTSHIGGPFQVFEKMSDPGSAVQIATHPGDWHGHHEDHLGRIDGISHSYDSRNWSRDDRTDWYDHGTSKYEIRSGDFGTNQSPQSVGGNLFDGNPQFQKHDIHLLKGAVENLTRMMSQTLGSMDQKLDLLEKALAEKNTNLLKPQAELSVQQFLVDESPSSLEISKKNEAYLLVEERAVGEQSNIHMDSLEFKVQDTGNELLTKMVASVTKHVVEDSSPPMSIELLEGMFVGNDILNSTSSPFEVSEKGIIIEFPKEPSAKYFSCEKYRDGSDCWNFSKHMLCFPLNSKPSTNRLIRCNAYDHYWMGKLAYIPRFLTGSVVFKGMKLFVMCETIKSYYLAIDFSGHCDFVKIIAEYGIIVMNSATSGCAIMISTPGHIGERACLSCITVDTSCHYKMLGATTPQHTQATYDQTNKEVSSYSMIGDTEFFQIHILELVVMGARHDENFIPPTFDPGIPTFIVEYCNWKLGYARTSYLLVIIYAWLFENSTESNSFGKERIDAAFGHLGNSVMWAHKVILSHILFVAVVGCGSSKGYIYSSVEIVGEFLEDYILSPCLLKTS
ncbi:uncharacterized protein LOC119988489 [Tripterygium wilfordii]|uniref:uncharacterized protein LOC119988489 n=1 Tax=Tripterygium wilfordii TaxID=458696 RepID=UPI0018F81010|nr:uncharacterized protein LOC119988489 [Tripterygium wilfordii]